MFWIILCILNIFAIYFIYHNLPSALSLIDIDTKMSRNGSLEAADSLHTYLGIDLHGYRQATTFTSAPMLQNYVELKGGGKEVFRDVIAGDDFHPYYWMVRHFREGEPREFNAYFTPAGNVWGFSERVPESEEGPALSRELAQSIAEHLARERWSVDLDSYVLIEAAQEEKPNGRIDHSFTYERQDIRLTDAYYRLQLQISGDRLTTLRRLVKIPDSFLKEFTEMRSFNNTLAMVASALAAVLYGTAMLVWFVVLLRKKQLIIKPALFWTVFIAILYFAANINYISLYWFGYNTSTPESSFFFQILLQLAISTLFLGALNLVTIVIAEGATRHAYPHKVQFWRLADRDVASTRSVLGYVVGSYLTVPLFMAITVGFYIISASKWGWWIPSSTLANPDILGAISPAISAIGVSLWAGFWEESLFRAVPLATMAYIGARYNKRVFFLTIGMIIQVFIFSAAHANYSQQPFYARLVELIIPSLMFAFLYLRVGLLPAILVHFFYNAIWSSLGFFTMQAPGLWLDRTIMIAVFFFPLVYVLILRILSRDWRVEEKTSIWNAIYRFFFYSRRDLPLEKLNLAYTLHEESVKIVVKAELDAMINAVENRVEEKKEPTEKRGRCLSLPVALFVTLLIVLVGFLLFSANGRPAELPQPRLEISSFEAVDIADRALAEWLDAEIPESFTPYPFTFTTDQNTRYFVSDRNGIDAYAALRNRYIFEDGWRIVYKRFEGTLQERAEQYTVLLASNGEVIDIRHQIAEEIPGANLNEREARQLAVSALTGLYDYEQLGIREISASPQRQPERTDWQFTFSDTLAFDLTEGEARISVNLIGDEVAAVRRYIFIPEEENRSIYAALQKAANYKMIAIPLMLLFIIMALGFAFVRWNNQELDTSIFRNVFIILLFLYLLDTLNSWNLQIGWFNTIEPFKNQLTGMIIGNVLEALFFSAFIALLVAFCRSWQNSRSYYRPGRLPLIPLIIAWIVSLVAIRYLIGEDMIVANILRLPNYEHTLKITPIVSLLLAMARTYLILFGLISFLFYVLENLFAKGVFLKIIGVLILILFGMVGSVVYRFEYYAEPFITAILLRGLVFTLLLYILYVVMVRLKASHWIIISLLLFAIVPLVGIIQEPFSMARPTYLVAYLLIVLSFARIRSKKQKKK